MGGQNHQPCRKYLPDSTEISRSLSLAYAELELGNVALEDLLLNEPNGGGGSVSPITKRLIASISSLKAALQFCSNLRSRMSQLDFVDLPTLQNTDLAALGERLSAEGMIVLEAWAVVADKMNEGGFEAMLSVLETKIQELIILTQELGDAINRLEQAAAVGKLSAILEENRQGNIKPQFAKLYCAWSTFNQIFLASSLLSTELWYILTGKASLCSSPAAKKGVA